MIIVPPIPFRRRARRANAASAAPVRALTLVAAVFNSDAPFVQLQFDREIDISGIDVSVVFVDSGDTSFRYQGVPTPSLTDPKTVQVPLNGIDDYSGVGDLLSVNASSGIVAVDDGGTWAGVSGLEMPFP